MHTIPAGQCEILFCVECGECTEADEPAERDRHPPGKSPDNKLAKVCEWAIIFEVIFAA
jgi:hypothetical protein